MVKALDVYDAGSAGQAWRKVKPCAYARPVSARRSMGSRRQAGVAVNLHLVPANPQSDVPRRWTAAVGS